MKAYKFKTETANGRISATTVFKPQQDIIVVNQRVLAKQEDIDDGWFENSKTIKKYKNYLLREVQIVFWTKSFDAIIEIVKNKL